MTHRLNLLIIINLCIATTQQCNAMENKLSIPKPKILFELTTTPDEKFAAFISNNRAIINGKNSCRIMDLNNSSPVLTIEDMPTDNTIHLHPNKKCFALCNENKITIYDAEKGTKNVALPFFLNASACWFIPLDGTMFLVHDINTSRQLMYYNYHTNVVSPTSILFKSCPIMDVHPTKQQICQNRGGMIHIYGYDKKFNFYKQIQQFDSLKDTLRMIYSPNGSHIGTFSSECIQIINLDNNRIYEKQVPLDNDSYAFFSTIEFHPNSAVLAALSLVTNKPKNYSVTLWYLDNNKKQTIAKISLFDYISSLRSVPRRQALSFSPDGTKIMIKLRNFLIVLPVPLEVIYQPEAHKKLLLIYWLLNNNNLPNDIMLNLLEAFKR